MTSSLRVVLAGGGTGGHVIPAISLATALRERGATVSFVGTRGRLEERLVPKAGFDLAFVDVKPLVGAGIRGKLLGVASLPKSILDATLHLREVSPDVVMGVGGYVAGPVVLAAALLRIPTALLEQNATLGMSNRLLKPWVKKAFFAYEAPMRLFPDGVGCVTGNPIKPSIIAASKRPRKNRGQGRVRLLVMGGSQGAKAIDERVPAALIEAGLQTKIDVVHQCASVHVAQVTAAYEAGEINAEVVSFIEDTASAYLDADLVVARSGATTVSELQAMGLPSVLLPYPHHKDKQQTLNAEPLRQVGGAVVLDETSTSVGELASAIRAFVTDDVRLRAAGKSAATLGRIDAAGRISDTLFELAGGDDAGR